MAKNKMTKKSTAKIKIHKHIMAKTNQKKNPKKNKLKVAFFGITGCAGCQLSFLFTDEDVIDLLDKIDVVNFPFIKEKAKSKSYDITFMEGLVADEQDLKTLKEVRKNSKILIALGACAHTGCVPAYRRFTSLENFEHLLFKKKKELADLNPGPISEHVAVDFTIPGCPPDKEEIKYFIKQFYLGKDPRNYEDPVCIECRKNGNECLLDIGKPCLGPITRGGCNAVCINGGFECWGCRGPTKDANMEVMIKLLLEKGHSREFIIERMRIFVGTKHDALEKYLKELKGEAKT